jgi:hypothetical protein
MFGLYTPVLLLQAFCIYHAYRNHSEQRWYWLIICFPLGGCIIYLVHNFNNRATIDTITESVKEVVISNYRIEQLEKTLRFSDSLSNKLNLADAYMEVNRFQNAVDLYKDCLNGFMSDDVALQMKLLYAHYLNSDFEGTIVSGSKLESEKSFKNSKERVAYAWSLFHVGKPDLAEAVFSDMDRSFTNYQQRMEYCKFLLKMGSIEFAKEKLAALMEEFEHMKSSERKFERNTIREIRDLYTSHVRA